MRKVLLSVSSTLFVLASYSAAFAQVTPQGALGQLGTVQQQDLDSARRLEEERQGILVNYL